MEEFDGIEVAEHWRMAFRAFIGRLKDEVDSPSLLAEEKVFRISKILEEESIWL